jgi:hypothetical protein
MRNDFLKRFDYLAVSDDLAALRPKQKHIDDDITNIDSEIVAEEDPRMVQESLKLMDMEIERRKGKSGGAYLLAESANPAFFKDHRLRMICIRCCNFNGKNAASQLFDFLEAKLDLFGPDKIAERITLSNMGAGARGALENGSKDLGGHQVIFNNTNCLGGYDDGDDAVRHAIFRVTSHHLLMVSLLP